MRKGSAFIGLMIVFVFVFLLTVLAVYRFDITGRVPFETQDNSGGGGSGGGIFESGSSSGGSGGGSGGSPSDGQVLNEQFPSISYNDPDISIELASSFSTENNKILVKEPVQDRALVNQLVGWKTSISVPEKIESGSLKLGLARAKYARITSPQDAQVSVNTKKASGNVFESIFNSGADTGNEQNYEFNIVNPVKGEYEVSFFTNPAYVSEDETLKNGDKRIVVNNPTSINYGSIFVYTKVQSTKNSDQFVVEDGSGNKIDSVSYDSDNDGRIDLVKFSVQIPSTSEKTFQITKTSREDVTVGDSNELNNEIRSSSNVGSTILSDECSEDLDCGDFGACSLNYEAGQIIGSSSIVGSTKEKVCRSSNPDCPPSTKIIDSCSLSHNVKILPETNPSIQSEQGFSQVTKAVTIYDTNTGNKVAILMFDKLNRKLDIVFD